MALRKLPHQAATDQSPSSSFSHNSLLAPLYSAQSQLWFRINLRIKQIILYIGLVLFSFWLYKPVLTGNLPYFSDEDEAHHFNRIVRMVQAGDFNPHYFLKPSLHFYLRMPIVAASFLWEVKSNRAREISDIKTKDEYGIGRYAFSASHPTIVKINRCFSLGLLAIAAGGMIYLLSHQLGRWHSVLSPWSLLLLICAPATYLYAATIAVDIVVTCFAVLTAVSTSLACRNPSVRLFLGAGLCAGLTISSKYNAAPILLTPFVAALLCSPTPLMSALTVLASSITGFCVGTPYLFAELPLFLNHIAYELWHYGVVGHEGHSAEPGLSQAWFYISWFFNTGLGVVPTLCAIIGIGYALLRGPHVLRAVAIFPTTYFIFMSLQRANFTRNMLPLLPFLVFFATTACVLFLQFAPLRKLPSRKRIALSLLLLGVVLVQPLIQTFFLRNRTLALQPDSRDLALQWLRTHVKASDDVAVQSWLQFPLSERRSLNLHHIAFQENAPDTVQLFQDGFSTLITHSQEKLPNARVIHSLPGQLKRERIVVNPALLIWQLNPEVIQQVLFSAPVLLNERASWSHISKTPCRELPEGHCWITQRLTRIEQPDSVPHDSIHLTVMSPWPQQRLRIIEGQSGIAVSDYVTISQPGEWRSIVLPTSTNTASTSQSGVWLEISDIHSPLLRGLSSDTRRLGLAVRQIEFKYTRSR
jgi:Dolichyl-phosphate-mannose-protein mannosyltransferase